MGHFCKLLQFIKPFSFSIGDESLHVAFRFLTASELYRNAYFYGDHPKFSEARTKTKLREETIISAVFSKNAYQEYLDWEDPVSAVKTEAIMITTCQFSEYASFIALCALTSVLHRPVFSVYPEANEYIRPMMHGMVHPQVCKFTKRFHILWSQDGTLDSSSGFTPNHFVPLMKLSNKKEKRDRLKTSMLITNPISEEGDSKNILF